MAVLGAGITFDSRYGRWRTILDEDTPYLPSPYPLVGRAVPSCNITEDSHTMSHLGWRDVARRTSNQKETEHG